ncbi:MAG: GNAT family N-acetyltransferase [Gemmatimonadetes bacterium]|nr:MAG: GNAT family N-acetyltransferase [Gemmatimonadota bacterium]
MATKTAPSIPDATIEALVRSFFKEASAYGFKQADYLRFVNQLLDLALHQNSETRLASSPSATSVANPTPTELPIKSDRLWIREFKLEQDRRYFDTWLEDEFGRYFLLSRTTARTANFDDLIRSPSTVAGMITLPDETPIGAVLYLNVDQQHRKAELRKLIGEPSMRGKGLAKEATRLWLRYGASRLSLNKIYLNTLNTNLRNIKLNEDLGFKVEGILRNEVFFDGEYRDVLRMGFWCGE